MKLFEGLKCSSCGKSIEKDEIFYPVVKNNGLNGITNLKSWFQQNKIYCKSCIKEAVNK